MFLKESWNLSSKKQRNISIHLLIESMSLQMKYSVLDDSFNEFNYPESEFSLPKNDSFYLLCQSEFQQNVIEELKTIIYQKNKDQAEIRLDTDQIQEQSQQQQQQQRQYEAQLIEFPTSSNLKQFAFQKIEESSIRQDELCGTIVFNCDSSIVAAGCENHIKLYQFKQQVLIQIQVLCEHKIDITTLNFMKKSYQLISGDYGGSTVIWQSNNNNQWICSQIIQGNMKRLNCLILNDNENLFISSSDDKTIKFWVNQNGWVQQQTIKYHASDVYQLSLNDSENKLISCGWDHLILIIENSDYNQKWTILQKLQVDCQGIRLCFINNNLFTFQPIQGNLMHVYELDSVSNQFTKTKDIFVNEGNDSCVLFPQKYIKSKQLLVNKHGKQVNLLKKTENDNFKVVQSIQFETNIIFGQLSLDGEYLIIWDNSKEEISIRKYLES